MPSSARKFSTVDRRRLPTSYLRGLASPSSPPRSPDSTGSASPPKAQISAVLALPESGEELTKRAIQETLNGSKCYRCGKIPIFAHDGPALGFCPAFSEPGESGRWLDLSNILHFVRRRILKHSRGTFRVFAGTRIEEHWSWGSAYGLNKSRWHLTLGSTYEGKWASRLDAEALPEFSIYYPYRNRHTVVYRGWRYYLPVLCERVRIPWLKLAQDLGVSPDRSTEHIRRWEVGWL